MLRILLRDFKRLLKAPAALIVVGALLVLPSLYTWYNVAAFWDPYGATGNLQVCVVNQDAGTVYETTGQLDVGDKLVEELQKNDQLSWVTDKNYDEAIADLKAGDVYAVYVVPEDFSSCLVSPLTGKAVSPRIEYYANEKLGPVSPKITDAAASALEQKINSAFVATVTEVATQAIDDAVQKAETDISTAKGKVSGRADKARAAVVKARKALAKIGTKIDEARSKVAATSGAIADTSTLADDVRAVLRDVTDEAEALQASLANIAAKSVPELSGVLAKLTKATAKASALADAIAASTGEAQADVDIAAARIQPVVDTMNEAVSDLKAAAAAVSDEKLSARLEQAAQNMSARADEMQAVLDGATKLAEEAGDATQTAAKTAERLDQAAQQASDSLAQYSHNLHGTTSSTIGFTVAQIGDVCARLSAAVSSLDAAVGQVRPVFSQVDGILGDCKTAISQTDALIGGVQDDLDSVMADARLLAQSDVITNLLKNGTLNARNISEFMGAPTELSTTAFYHPNAYGTAMAPLFMNLTFWIGAFMLVIIFLLEVDSEGFEELKPWQRYLGRFLMFCIFAVIQALICCAGTLALGVEAVHAPALFAASAVASLAYLSVIYALSSTFRHVGKALCIVLVFAQIPGGSGLYPVEMTSSFFQAIYPFLPFTYGIDAMRESIGGFYGSYYAQDLLALGAFFFGSLAFGLVVGPLMSNVVRMTAQQVREGDLYNGEDAITPARPYRLAHLLRALTEKNSYRNELEARYARFSRRYPVFIRTSIVLGLGVPIVLGLLLALDTAEKTVLLTCLLVWLIALIGFLVVVESQRYSFERQLNLERMSEARVMRLFANRNHMTRIGARFGARREADDADAGDAGDVGDAGDAGDAAAGDDADAVEGDDDADAGDADDAGASDATEGDASEGEEAADEGAGAGDEQQGGFKALEAAPSAQRKSAGGMRNVWLIARRDLSGLFKNVMSVVITVGLVVLPSLFAWYNILACWNVFDNTNQLSIAVASDDAGYESDLLPLNVNVGEKVVSALRANSQIKWVFTDSHDALEGVKAGKYYAALVIPEGFSQDMLTFYEGDSRSATIDYYVNEKKNAIAPNITGMGADTVSHEVNSAFAKTVSEVAIGVAQSLSQAAEEGDAGGRVASLAEHMRNVATRLDQSADVLGLYSSVGRDTQGLVRSSAEIVASARKSLQGSVSDIDAGKARVRSLAERLSNSVEAVGRSLDKAHTAVAGLKERADAMIADISAKVSKAASKLRGKASEIDAKAAKLSDALATLEKIRDALKSGASVQVDAAIADGKANVKVDLGDGSVYQSEKALAEDIDALSSTISALEDGKAALKEALVDELAEDKPALQKKIDDIDAQIKRLSETRETLRELLDSRVDVDVDIEAELSAQAEALVENTIVLDKDIAALKKAVDVLGKASAACTDAADALEAGSAKVEKRAGSLRRIADRVKESVAAVRQDLKGSLAPGASRLKADVATLAGDLERGADALRALDPDLAGSLESVAAALGKAASKIDKVDAKLHGAAQRVRDLADAVDNALKTGDVDKLRSLLQGSAGDLAAALAAPVQIERTALFPAANFGSAMTPLYCTLALFIGALLIMVAMKPEVSRRGREELVDPKPRHLYFGRFVAVAAVSLMQTTLLGLGNMLFLKVQVADPVLFMVGFWFSGLVLAFIVYTLVVAFGNLGKALAVLLLIVQVTACGGSYPLQVLPDFVQAISPWVPATYIVNMLRAAMMGVYLNDFWVSLGYLALFIVPFLLLGLFLRKPMSRFMKFYVRKVEECGIMA